ncbi:MAG: BP74-related protein [Gemmatimonadaceae bacterium]
MRFVRLRCIAAIVLAACGSDGAVSPNVATFVVRVGSEQFMVRVTDQATFEKMSARMQSGQAGVIMGRVARGSGGFNQPWSWHLLPETIQVPDVAIELCDGTPSYLEAHRDEWINTVRNYCPWGAKVVSVRG